MIAAVDRGDFAMLVLLDLSTTFNTVDHDILLERLQRTFGFNGNVLRWMASYLTGRSECVRRGPSCSKNITAGVWRASRFRVGTATVSDVYGRPDKVDPTTWSNATPLCG